MTCCYCGGDMAETTTTYFEQLENMIVIIKNVPSNAKVNATQSRKPG